MQQVTEYSAVCAAVQSAIAGDASAETKWQKVAAIVPAFYGTAEALIEGKAQFVADAIAPALPKRHAQAIAVELPRKNSKEYAALDEAGRARWQAATEAKADARATYETTFKRVLAKAFPPVKGEGDEGNEGTKTLETKLAKAIADCISKIEKAEAPAFDAPTALAGLRAALAAVTAK